MEAKNAGNVRSTIIVVVVLAVALTAGWFAMPKKADAGSSQTVAVAGPRVGQVAPDFTATTTTGETVTLSQLRGKSVWLNFGGTWCPGCRSEAPDLMAVQDLAAANGVVMISVYLDETDKTAAEFAKTIGMTFPQIADPKRAVGEKYQSTSVPVHFFIGPDQTITKVHQGAFTRAEMEQQITAMSPGR